MRQTLRVALVFCVLAFAATAAAAQQEEAPPPPPKLIVPYVPPPPPEIPPPPPLPERVSVPAGLGLGVELETPMSTRITKVGQTVTFRTTTPVQVFEGLAIPQDTAIHGHVITMQKPGGFGKGGVIRVKLESIELAAGSARTVAARLESADMDAQGRLRGDSVSGTNVLELAQWGLTGTLIGAQAGGMKGAGIGAGAGALAALIIMMSRRGSDLYVEPGTPFRVVIESPLEFTGQELFAAQQEYDKAHPPAANADGTSTDANGIPDSERPKLKRRPKPIK